MQIVHKLSVDLQSPSTTIIYVKQGDKLTRYVELSLHNAGSEYTPANANILQVVFVKPDRTGGVYDTMPDGETACTIEGNVVTAKLHPQMFTCPGVVKCELRMLNNEGTQTLSTFGWLINVEPSAESEIASESYYRFASIESMALAIGDLADLDTQDKNSIVGAINELHSATVSLTKAEAVARSTDGCNYSANVEGLIINVGTEIILLPQSANASAPTLSINGGDAYPLCLRPGWNVTGDDLHPQLTLPIPEGMLLRGAEYVFRFDGYSWILQSYVEKQERGYIDVTEKYTADDDYRDHPEEYLRSLGEGKWQLIDVWDAGKLYRMEIFVVDGQEWRIEKSWTDDGIYTMRMFNASREIVSFDSGNEELTVNGIVIAPSGGGTNCDCDELPRIYAQLTEPTEAPDGSVWIVPEVGEGTATEKLYIQSEEPVNAPDGSVWIVPGGNQGSGVSRTEMEQYVAKAINAALAAIPEGEEMLFG